MAEEKKTNKFADSFKSGRFASRTIAFISILALSLATGLLFINPTLSLVIYALSGIALFFGNSLEDRKVFEGKARKSFEVLQRRYDNLVLQVEKNKNAITTLSREIERVSEDLETQKKTAKISATPPKAPSFKDVMNKVRKSKSKDEESAPRKASLAYTPFQLVANDEPRSGHYNDTLSDLVVHELMSHAVRHKDIELFVQPIVRLPMGDTRFYEVFGRVKAREGSYISASRYMEFARQDKLVGQIDQQVLLHALQTLREKALMDDMPSFFLNIETSSLKDMGFMNVLLAFLAKNRTLSQKLVLEISKDAFENRDQKLNRILKGLQALGCAFSLDHINSMDLNIADLVSMKVRFVKFPAMLLMDNMQSQKQSASLLKMKRQLENNGIGVIAERIENIKTLDKLSVCQLHYGQGYLFGKPDTQLNYSLKRAA